MCQKQRRHFKPDHSSVLVCYACNSANLNSHFMHAGKWQETCLFVFFLQGSDRWNGTCASNPPGCDEDIISSRRIHWLTEERSPEGGHSWDWTRLKRLPPAPPQWESKVQGQQAPSSQGNVPRRNTAAHHSRCISLPSNQLNVWIGLEAGNAYAPRKGRDCSCLHSDDIWNVILLTLHYKNNVCRKWIWNNGVRSLIG